MKTRLLSVLLALTFITTLIAGCSSEQPTTAQAKVEMNISAAVSLKDALEEIQKNYEAKNPNVKLIYNLGASGALQKQIEQGAPADIFMSAASKQMSDLEAEGLVNKSTRKNLVENRLVIIVPKTSNLNITKYEDLAKEEVQKISIGETASVPAGQYAQEVLQKLEIWDNIKAKAVLAKDVRTVLTYVETDNVDAGIVYKTDALSSNKVKIVANAPEGSHQPIVYPVALLSGTKQQQAAEDFLAYLSTPECKAIFEKYGFTMSK
jgi:molybdate transport system substrate-binding protein